MDRHGFLPVDHWHNKAFRRCDAVLSYTVCNDRGVSGPRTSCNLGQRPFVYRYDVRQRPKLQGRDQWANLIPCLHVEIERSTGKVTLT